MRTIRPFMHFISQVPPQWLLQMLRIIFSSWFSSYTI
jgi:hypothetical protein